MEVVIVCGKKAYKKCVAKSDGCTIWGIMKWGKTYWSGDLISCHTDKKTAYADARKSNYGKQNESIA